MGIDNERRRDADRYCDHCRDTLDKAIADASNYAGDSMKEAKKKVSWTAMTILVIVLLAVMGYFSTAINSNLSLISQDVKKMITSQYELQRQVDKNTIMQSNMAEKLNEHMREKHN